MLSGAVTALVDNARERRAVRLAVPGMAILMPPGTWGGYLAFAPGTMLGVFCSEPYDPADRIPDYRTFLKRYGGHERLSDGSPPFPCRPPCDPRNAHCPATGIVLPAGVCWMLRGDAQSREILRILCIHYGALPKKPALLDVLHATGSDKINNIIIGSSPKPARGGRTL